MEQLSYLEPWLMSVVTAVPQLMVMSVDVLIDFFFHCCDGSRYSQKGNKRECLVVAGHTSVVVPLRLVVFFIKYAASTKI